MIITKRFIYYFRINYDVACPMDFRKYPYDTQSCKVKYESCKYLIFYNHTYLNTNQTWILYYSKVQEKLSWLLGSAYLDAQKNLIVL